MSEEENEKPKRIDIKKNVLKKLLLLSGNICAMPGCKEPLIDDNGNVVCEICHIEAAETGGPRFNPNMTNEQRADFSNLILLCPTCHTKVDKDAGQKKYTVEMLRDIKANHEKRMMKALFEMEKRFVDQTETQQFIPAKNAKKLKEVLDWKITEQELEETLPSINIVGEKLKVLPPETRSLFCVMLGKAEKGSFRKLEVLLTEVEKATGATKKEMLENLEILQKYCFVTLGTDDDSGLPIAYLPSNIEDGLDDCWEHFCEFSQQSGISLKNIIEDLDFSVFDN